MTVFVSGGAKNGKSSFAQELAVKLANGKKHYYVATMIPADAEDRERIRKHLDDRAGMGFETIECGRNILSCLDKAEKDATFLLDSVTALLMNELFPDPTCGEVDTDAACRCAEELVTFAQSVGNAVFVSDFIYSDAACYDESTEIYRACLAAIDQRLVAVCDTVVEAAAGNFTVHKGEAPL